MIKADDVLPVVVNIQAVGVSRKKLRALKRKVLKNICKRANRRSKAVSRPVDR